MADIAHTQQTKPGFVEGEATLRLEAVKKSYMRGKPGEIEVLHGIDLVLGRGEFVALIGPSGSGKSTLLNLIGLLDKPSSGELFLTGVATVSLDDSDLTKLRANAIGFVFQFHNLLPAFTAVENVLLPLLAKLFDSGFILLGIGIQILLLGVGQQDQGVKAQFIQVAGEGQQVGYLLPVWE